MYLADHISFRKEPALSYDKYQGAIDKCEGVIAFGVDYFHLLRHTLGVLNSENLIPQIHDCLLTLGEDLPGTKYLHDGQFILFIDKSLSSVKYQEICHRISGIFDHLFYFEGHELFLTFSFGIALQDSNQSGLLSLVDRAYHALHQAKKRGQNQLVFYQNDLTEDLIKKLSLKTQIYKAIKNQEFFLNYQPYIDIQTTRCLGIEALLRWQHPDYGVLAPKDFLLLAESTNLIVPLGRWVLEQSLKDLRLLYNQGYTSLDMAINISAKQLAEEDFVPFILRTVENCGLPFNKICLELTESELFEKSSYVIEKLHFLKKKGFLIVIDDFGVGYSNLNYLISLPVDKIKIDRSFLSLIEENRAEILNAMFDLARRLKIKTVVEGIETHEQLTFLQKTGCDEGQGFYMGKPMQKKDLLLFFQHSAVDKIS